MSTEKKKYNANSLSDKMNKEEYKWKSCSNEMEFLSEHELQNYLNTENAEMPGLSDKEYIEYRKEFTNSDFFNSFSKEKQDELINAFERKFGKYFDKSQTKKQSFKKYYSDIKKEYDIYNKNCEVIMLDLETASQEDYEKFINKFKEIDDKANNYIKQILKDYQEFYNKEKEKSINIEGDIDYKKKNTEDRVDYGYKGSEKSYADFYIKKEKKIKPLEQLINETFEFIKNFLISKPNLKFLPIKNFLCRENLIEEDIINCNLFGLDFKDFNGNKYSIIPTLKGDKVKFLIYYNSINLNCDFTIDLNRIFIIKDFDDIIMRMKNEFNYYISNNLKDIIMKNKNILSDISLMVLFYDIKKSATIIDNS